MRIGFLADFLKEVDQAAMGSAPNMTPLIMIMIIPTSGSETPAHAGNGSSAPRIGKDSQWVLVFAGLNLLFDAKRTIEWMAATPE